MRTEKDRERRVERRGTVVASRHYFLPCGAGGGSIPLSAWAWSMARAD